MVHARTFSFTDNSVNVAFPSSPSKEGGPKAMTTAQSSDPALLLFQLRRAQSFWYQDLYQSHAIAPLREPSAFVWRMCLEMREWGDSLPNNIPIPVRQMFDQELRYSYVYCIAPSARAPEITDYHRILIFEYTIAYLDTMYEIAHNGLNSTFYSYHDALKVYFMASQLIAVLYDAEDMLLMGSGVHPPATRPGTAPPPPIPRRAQVPGTPYQDNIALSLSCLDRVDQTLGKFGERWEESGMLKTGFEAISGETLDRLRARRDMQNVALDQHQQGQFPNGGQMPLQGQAQPQQQQQQQQPRDIRWMAVNPAQMMRGPPQQ